MPTNTDLRQTWPTKINFFVERILYGLSMYALPLFIGIISVIALFLWQPEYGPKDLKQLTFRVIEESDHALTPAEALKALQEKVAVTHHDTRLSEASFWFSFSVHGTSNGAASMVDLPSRHARTAACWDGRSLQPLGGTDRTVSVGFQVCA